MNRLTILAAVVAASAIGTAAQAGPSSASFAYSGGLPVTLTVNGSTVLTARSRGWIDDNGVNNGGGSTANYIAGVCGSSDGCFGSDDDHHNYFVFDLDGIGPISSAVLNLTQSASPAGYISPTLTLTYTMWDTDVGAAALSTTNGLALFNDLNGGISFGSVVVDASTNGTVVDVVFNGAGLAALNASTGGLFGFGGSIGSPPPAVPESSTWAMMIAGFGAVGFAMRRRQKVALSFA